MKHYRITTVYIDGYDYASLYGNQPEGFDSIEAAIKWNQDKNIDLYLVRFTEWDGPESADAYGVPEVLERGNLTDHEESIHL